MSGIEVEVRRMLERRAADIEDSSGRLSILTGGGHGSGPSKDQKLPSRRNQAVLLSAAVVVVLLGVTAAFLVGNGFGLDGNDLETVNEAASDEDEHDEVANDEDGADEVLDNPSSELSTASFTTAQAMAEALATLPSGFDPLTSPAVDFELAEDGPDAGALRYLSDRVGQPAQLVPFGSEGGTSVYHWSVESSVESESGWLLLREDTDRLGIVAVTTTGISFHSVERGIDSVRVEVEVVDHVGVSVVLGTVYGSTFGSAEVISGPTAVIEHPVTTEVVTVTASGTDAPPLVEFAIDSVGFAASCGSEPPISIDTGSMAGPLAVGPATEGAPLLANQQAWHHPGPFASIEILWPATPSLISDLPPQEWEPTQAWSFGHPFSERPEEEWAEDSSADAAIYLGGDIGDPCSVVQIVVTGHERVADWWAYALRSEWNFGFPLSVADLDPNELETAEGPETIELAPPADLVIASVTAEAKPTIPASGTCDGLPDDPPRSGPGSDSQWPTSDDALQDFITTSADLDANFPPSGYTEVVSGDGGISYIIAGEDFPYVVIDVVEQTGNWSVEGWATSAC